ncbi:MAG: hypothetical protein EZS28_003937 [Streblomastix strix]|uniref:Uncharacterized protein n=1 Tax=Streblomastix strix TaxID=222440 RepID=A0A5J4X067_9EUKA|nr:MAG: hypothetical protein EZS28_003937 [Streblomastix strix]
MQDTQMTLTQPKVDEQGLQVTSDNIPVKTWKTWYFDKDRYEKLPQSRRILIERPGFMQVLDKLKVERNREIAQHGPPAKQTAKFQQNIPQQFSRSNPELTTKLGFYIKFTVSYNPIKQLVHITNIYKQQQQQQQQITKLREILPQLEGLNQEEQLIKAQQELDQMDYELYLKELKELPVVFASEGQFSPQNAGDTQNLDEQQQQQQQQQTQLLSNTTSTPIRQRINNSSTTTRSHSIPHSTLMKDTQFYFTPQQLKKMNISTPFSQNMSQTYNSSSFLNQTARSQTQSRSNTAQQQYTERYIPSLAPPLTEDLEYNSKELNNIDLQVKTSMKRTKRFVEQTTAIEKGLYGKNITEIPPYNKNLRKVQTDLKHQRFLDSQQKDIKKQQGFLKSQNMIEQMHDNLVMQQTRQALTQNSLERMGAYNSQIGLLDLKEDSNSPIKYTAMYTPALTPDFASGSNRYQKPMAQTQTQSQQGTTRERFVAYERPKQLNPLLYGKAANLSRKLAEKEAQEEKQKELDKKGSKKDINNT